MIYKWLHKHEQANEVIVFFSGWGFDQKVVERLTANGTDVLFIYDYTNIEIELPKLNSYKKCNLVAWSFGVGHYALWQAVNPDPFTNKVAINGTVATIDRLLGIPKKVVQHTINSLTYESYQEFVKRCFNQDDEHLTADCHHIDIDKLKNELTAISQRNYLHQHNWKWDKVWLSLNDKIYPTKNQQRAWQSATFETIDESHAPFNTWSNWQQLLT